MGHIHAFATPRGAPTVKALLLHPPGAATAARRLVRAWSQPIPLAEVSTLQVPSCMGADAVSALLAHLLDRAGLAAERLVLAGVCGAEAAALQIAFARNAPTWAGVLICGSPLLPLKPLADVPVQRGTRLRLVWDVADPLVQAAALAELLRWFRAAGLDAQGSVLGRQEGSPSPSPALVRRGGAYLAELVAVALGPSCRPARTEAAILTPLA